jgi:hypothetical protein
VRGPGCLARHWVVRGRGASHGAGSLRDRAVKVTRDPETEQGLSAGSHPPARRHTGGNPPARASHRPAPRSPRRRLHPPGIFSPDRHCSARPLSEPEAVGARREAGPCRFWGAGAAGCGRSLRGARWVQGRGPGAERRGSSPRAQVWRGAGKPPGSGVGLRRGSRPEGVCVGGLCGARGGAPMGSGTQAWREAGRRFRGGAGRRPGGSTGADLEGRGGSPAAGRGGVPLERRGCSPAGKRVAPLGGVRPRLTRGRGYGAEPR